MTPRPEASRHRFLVGAALAGPPGAVVAQALAHGVAGHAMQPHMGWSAVLLALVVAPVLEELVFRGGLQEALERMPWARAERGGLTAGNLLTSIVFAAVHLGTASAAMALATFLPSLLFGRLKQLYEPSLRPAIAIHAWYNLNFLAAGCAWAFFQGDA